MPNLLRILKFLNKLGYLLLPSRLYKPLRSYALKMFLQGQDKVLSPCLFFKLIIQYILPYRAYLWLKAKVSKMQITDVDHREVYCSSVTENDFNKNMNSPQLLGNIKSIVFLNHQLNYYQKVCRVVICCAFTGRYQVLATSIQESFQSKYALEIEWVLCGTTMEDALFIDTMRRNTKKVTGFICANNPLGQKWQNCISFAGKCYDSEFYAIVGSDDIISAKLIDYIVEQNANDKANKAQEPVLYATLNWFTMVTDPSNFATSQVFQCKILPSNYFQPIGAARFYKGSFLKKIDFQIFDVRLERLLDDFGYHQVIKFNESVQLFHVTDGALISVKGAWSQLNTIKCFFDAKTLELTEFSFKGYDLIRAHCSPATCDFLFKKNDLAQQLNFSSSQELMFNF